MLSREIRENYIENERIIFADSGFQMLYLTAHDFHPDIGFIPHFHDNVFEILYIQQSSASIQYETNSYKATPGDIFIFNPGEIHSCMRTETNYQSKCFQIGSQLLSSHPLDRAVRSYIAPVFHKTLRFPNLYRANDTLVEIFKSIEREFLDKRPAYELEIKGLFYKFFTELVRSSDIINKQPISKDLLADERIEAIQAYIAEHYSEHIKLSDIANRLFLNESYLCRLFKKYTNTTLLNYIIHYRITQALKLLTTTDMSITQVSAETGFDDYTYFSRVFKKIVGVSPAHYRDKMTEK